MKILVIKLRSLGDTVLMTAPLAALHRAFPEAEIHVLAPSDWAEVLSRNPGIRKLWNWPRRPLARARIAVQLRRQRFDTIVNLHASPSSATLSRAIGASTRSIHFHGHSDPNRFSTVTVPGKGVLKPIIERDMDAIRALGAGVPQGLLPSVTLEESEKQWADLWLRGRRLPSPLLVLGLGASRPTKSWPIGRFASLAKGGIL